MKLNVLVGILLVFNSDGQSLKFEDVPPTVQATFFYVVSNASKAKWVMVDDAYQASLKQHGKAIKLLISESGILLMFEQDIKATELPHKISENLAMDYTGAHIIRVSKINRRGVFTYCVDARRKNWFYKLTFSSNGHIIEQSVKFGDK